MMAARRNGAKTADQLRGESLHLEAFFAHDAAALPDVISFLAG